MSITFGEFISQLFTSLPLAVTVLLTTGVILVNGWTDAPNAIATCVATRAMSAKNAIIMASIMNFLGVSVMTAVNSTVAASIYKMVNFSGNAHYASAALCAAMVAIVVWAVGAWAFGIPTSESHALIAGLSGAAIALNGNMSGINGAEWIKVLYGLGLSTALGFSSGWFVTKVVELLFRNANRKKSENFFRYAQISSGAAMAFMHGAQDGQKFMSVFLLGMTLLSGNTETVNFEIPIWLMIFCSVVMGVGTSIGGYKIIKSVGLDMVKLKLYQGFSSDLAAAGCLLVFSLTGIPVSTTHTKTTAVMGVGAANRISSINWAIVGEMALGWLLTFPGCGLIGFLLARLFINIF